MTVVPYRATARTRRPLDRQHIVATALALMEQVGLDGLTMRRLAEELDVTAGSLYRHVRDKEELLILLADELSARVPPIPEGIPWQQALTAAAVGYRRVLLAHRDAARLLASTPPAGTQRLRRIEAILRVLLVAGLGDRNAAWAAYHFNNLVTEFVADEVRIAAAAAAGGAGRAELMAQAREQLRGLPADEFPTIKRLADHLAMDDVEAVFEFGLRLWLRGMESLVARHRRGDAR